MHVIKNDSLNCVKNQRLLSDNRGFTMVSITVWATVLGIFAMAFAQQMQIAENVGKTARIASDLKDLRIYIVSNASCRAATICSGKAANSFVILPHRLTGQTIVAHPTKSSASQIGTSRYFVRARCQSSKKITVEYARAPMPSGTSAEGWKNLFATNYNDPGYDPVKNKFDRTECSN